MLSDPGPIGRSHSGTAADDHDDRGSPTITIGLRQGLIDKSRAAIAGYLRTRMAWGRPTYRQGMQPAVSKWGT